MKNSILKWIICVALAAIVSVTAILLIISVSKNDYPTEGEVFIVVSKQDLKLYVYQRLDGENIRLAEYPVCISQKIGAKQRNGDSKTPETTWKRPIYITEIVDVTSWVYDFQDGRGLILAYGDWFLRFSKPYNSVGIHGSTNNEETVPGRYSHGCIRMHDDDLIELTEDYVFEGMKVYIMREDEELCSFDNTIY